MKNLYVVMPGEASELLKEMVLTSTKDYNPVFLSNFSNMPDLRNSNIIFAIQLNNIGVNLGIYDFFSKLYSIGNDSLWGSKAVVFVHSPSNLYTKDMAQNIIFLANQLGCGFQGHPLVEVIENLTNFLTWQKKIKKNLKEVCLDLCRDRVSKLMSISLKPIKKPKLLVLHSSSNKTSNTLMLWNFVKENIVDCGIEELHVENGTVLDCIGCTYKACKHYSEQKSCFYGGTMIEEILPAIEKADALVWVCPNYNDSISANLMAVINRLTALYRRKKFYDKTMFAVIVSGNSGSDSVAKQLIGALNINKGFRLPPYFFITAIANDPGDINKVPNVKEASLNFALNLIKEVKA